MVKKKSKSRYASAAPLKLQRMYKHILERSLDRGLSVDGAERIAAATVNRHRAKLARGVFVVTPQDGVAGRLTLAEIRRVYRSRADVLAAVADLASGESAAVGRGADRVKIKRVRAPRLVGKGGSRRQWYPGKRVRKERYACLEHERTFRSKAALRAHYEDEHGGAQAKRAT